jgi:hypothetical protein
MYGPTRATRALSCPGPGRRRDTQPRSALTPRLHPQRRDTLAPGDAVGVRPPAAEPSGGRGRELGLGPGRHAESSTRGQMALTADAAGQLPALLAGRVPALWVDAYVGPGPQSAARALDLYKGHGSPRHAHKGHPGNRAPPSASPQAHNGRARCSEGTRLGARATHPNGWFWTSGADLASEGHGSSVWYRHPAGEGPTLRGMPRPELTRGCHSTGPSVVALADSASGRPRATTVRRLLARRIGFR